MPTTPYEMMKYDRRRLPSSCSPYQYFSGPQVAHISKIFHVYLSSKVFFPYVRPSCLKYQCKRDEVVSTSFIARLMVVPRG